MFYLSPNWNGFSFVAAVVIPSLDNYADGIDATSLSGTYSNGLFFATLAYEALSDDMVSALHGIYADYDKWRLGQGYTANGFHVGFIYEDRDLDGYDGNSWQLSGSYTASNNTFKAVYGGVEDMTRDLPSDLSCRECSWFAMEGKQWSVGVGHKLSNRTKIYAAYTEYISTYAEEDWDALSLGIVHSF